MLTNETLLESVTEKVLKAVNSCTPYSTLHTPDCKIQFKQLASSRFLHGFPAVYEDLTDNKEKERKESREPGRVRAGKGVSLVWQDIEVSLAGKGKARKLMKEKERENERSSFITASVRRTAALRSN